MKIEKSIAEKYWAKAAEEQLISDYTGRGYTVEREAKFGDFIADIIARKNDEIIVLELKSGSWSAQQAKNATELRNYVVHNHGAAFKIYFVSPPEEIFTEIEGLEELLLDFLSENIPGELMDLATHVQVSEIDGIDINSIVVRTTQIDVSGSATVYIDVQYGSDSDFNKGDGVRAVDSYPFAFEITIKTDLSTTEFKSIDVDTSSFYE